MDERGDTNDNADTSHSNSNSNVGGNASDSTSELVELVDLHAFLLGLVGSFNGLSRVILNPTFDDDSDPLMTKLMRIVVRTLRRDPQMEAGCVAFFRRLVTLVSIVQGMRNQGVASREDRLIQAVVDSGVIPGLVTIAAGRGVGSDDAAWTLIYFVSAGTKGHIQHAMEAGVLRVFVLLLESPSVDVRMETARILGNMANVRRGACESWRESLWDSGAIDALLRLLRRGDDADVLIFALFAVPFVWENERDEVRIRCVMATLEQLLRHRDEKVLTTACYALTSCLMFVEVPPGRVQTFIEMGLCRRFVELLQHKFLSVRRYVEELSMCS
jgi:Armadillo/beta-catenin-like repeat